MPAWKLSKRQAVQKMVFMWFVALLIGWLAASSGYSPLWLFSLCFVAGGGAFAMRVAYISNRDNTAAQTSRQVVEAPAVEPKPTKPQNRLYVPKD